MWQILNVEPTYGVCSICQSHECGVVDGKHQWIHCEALDDSRENIVIGYNCVKMFAVNLGIGKEPKKSFYETYKQEIEELKKEVLSDYEKLTSELILGFKDRLEMKIDDISDFTAASALSILELHEESKEPSVKGTKPSTRKRTR